MGNVRDERGAAQCAPCGAEHEGDGSQESDGHSSVQSLEFILRAMVDEPLGFLLVSFVFNVVLEITWRASLILDKNPPPLIYSWHSLKSFYKGTLRSAFPACWERRF